MKLTKSLWAVALIGLLFTNCKQTDSAPSEKGADIVTTEKTAAIKPETASFNIEGMSCSVGCAKTIEKELAAMEGVQNASVDFDKKTATVEFDATKQSPESLVKVVEAAADGKTYKVSNVQASGNQAMLFDQEKDKKDKKKTKKDEKSCSSDASAASSGKPACCAAKKSCSSDEKKASTL